MSSLNFLIGLFLIVWIPSHAQENDKDEIRQIFSKYKLAITNKKGAEALQYLDSNSIKYYNDILTLIKTSDSSGIESLTLRNKMTVLYMRYKEDKEKLVSMTGVDFFFYSLETGLLGNSDSFDIAEIFINNNTARAQVISSGSPLNIYFVAHKQNAMWKIDITSWFTQTDTTFVPLIRKSGLTTTQYFIMMLEKRYGQKPMKEIWTPVE